MEANSESRPLEIYFLPFLSPGHMIPLFEMARLFSARGEHVTIITTPSNVGLLHKSIEKDQAAGYHIRVHTVHFPAREVGLPDGLENFFSVTDLETAGKVYHAMTMMQKEIEQFVKRRPPNCIVADYFYPWTSDLAIRIRIPRLVFNATCIFALSCGDAVRRPDSPHRNAISDYDPFVIPNLPDPIIMTRSQLPDYVQEPNGYTQLMELRREAELKSYGVLVNSVAEFESEYIEHYQKIMGHKIWHIGPASMIHRNADEKANRGHKTVVNENECLSWLDSKKPKSVLYICFGSVCRFPDNQLYEIVCGIRASGHQFVWAMLGKDDEKEEDREKWLPKGFEEKIREENSGMIIRGWAPQVLILDHPSIACFLTHCGWNSVVEGLSAGVPMITWPLYSDHFYIEKLITQVHKVGVEVGAKDWKLCFEVGSKLVEAESVEKAVRKVMDDGDEAMEMRKRARELGEKAKKAVKEGGSSNRNLMALTEDLKKLSAFKGKE